MTKDFRAKRFGYYYDKNKLRYRYMDIHDYHVWLVRDQDNADFYVKTSEFNLNFFPCKLVDAGQIEII